MLEDHATGHPRPRECGERALKAGRMLYTCHETGTEEPWNTVAMAVCAFEGLHSNSGVHDGGAPSGLAQWPKKPFASSSATAESAQPMASTRSPPFEASALRTAAPLSC